uniref:Protein naked cuticle homolog n=1 Tax=Capra hircus TaxID=9925 RepID=A0A8C2PF86_CAPHI
QGRWGASRIGGARTRRDSIVVSAYTGGRRGAEEVGRRGCAEHGARDKQVGVVGLAGSAGSLVILPPEKAEAREGPGQLFCLDDGERAASREGARGLGKRRLNVDAVQCDVSVEEDSHQEWTFTLYGFDNSGKATREDMSSLMQTICEAVDASVHHCSGSSKTLRVKLTVSPEPSSKRKDGPPAVQDREPSRCRAEAELSEDPRVADRRLSAHVRRPSADPQPCLERGPYCRRNHYLDLAGVESYVSRFGPGESRAAGLGVVGPGSSGPSGTEPAPWRSSQLAGGNCRPLLACFFPCRASAGGASLGGGRWGCEPSGPPGLGGRGPCGSYSLSVMKPGGRSGSPRCPKLQGVRGPQTGEAAPLQSSRSREEVGCGGAPSTLRGRRGRGGAGEVWVPRERMWRRRPPVLRGLERTPWSAAHSFSFGKAPFPLAGPERAAGSRAPSTLEPWPVTPRGPTRPPLSPRRATRDSVPLVLCLLPWHCLYG